MTNIILLLLMNSAAILSLRAQSHTMVNPPIRRIDTAEQCSGEQASAGWMMDMATDEVEILVSPEKALVIVDRAPMINTADGASFLRNGFFGLPGTRLALRNEVEIIDDALLHGTYTGTLDGSPVVMDQYLMERNGVPLTLIRVVRTVQGSMPMSAYANTAYVRSLMGSCPADAGPTLMQR